MPVVLDQMNLYYTSRLKQIRDSLVIAATTKTSRLARLTMAIVAVVLCAILYYTFVVLPWGLFYTHLPRPICQEGNDDGSLHFGLWLHTYGGWKSDWEAKGYDLASFIALIFVTRGLANLHDEGDW